MKTLDKTTSASTQAIFFKLSAQHFPVYNLDHKVACLWVIATLFKHGTLVMLRKLRQ